MIDTLPIFPLQSVFLFPGTVLPLHIFEPRYRLMLDYCLENDEELGITSIKANGEIENLFGWGRVIGREPLPDGRLNIILQGMGIAKLVRYKSQEPFIIANVEKRENDFSHLGTSEYSEKVDQILELTKRHLQNLQADESFLKDLEKLKEHPFPIDVIASFLDINTRVKKEILVMENQVSRADILISFLMNKLKEENID
jgi:ATP-dependent Lon protease